MTSLCWDNNNLILLRRKPYNTWTSKTDDTTCTTTTTTTTTAAATAMSRSSRLYMQALRTDAVELLSAEWKIDESRFAGPTPLRKPSPMALVRFRFIVRVSTTLSIQSIDSENKTLKR